MTRKLDAALVINERGVSVIRTACAIGSANGDYLTMTGNEKAELGFKRRPADSTTLQIISTILLTFVCYLCVGLPLAVLPTYVHNRLGYGAVLAGLIISAQYVATMLSRPRVGQMADRSGPKLAVAWGFAICAVSGALIVLSTFTPENPALSYLILLFSRLALGVCESSTGTGAITWAIAQVGHDHTARVISWNGIASYGAIALGAPLGVILVQSFGFASIGFSILALGLLGLALALLKAAVPVIARQGLGFGRVFGRVLPHGLALALASTGFGSIATFITLFYNWRNWDGAALSLSLFGLFFVGARLLFANAINRFGGFRVALISLSIESAGLLLLWTSNSPGVAMMGAAVSGLGFSLVFPSLGVEAIARVPPQNRGSAIGAYSVFLDLSLGITGPVSGFLVAWYGYASPFLFGALATIAAVVITFVLYRQAPAPSQS